MTDEVPLCLGDEALVRMPTRAERHAHQLDSDETVVEPVIEIHRRNGTTEVYGSRQVTVLADRC